MSSMSTRMYQMCCAHVCQVRRRVHELALLNCELCWRVPSLLVRICGALGSVCAAPSFASPLGSGGKVPRRVPQPKALGGVSQVEGADVEHVLEAGRVGGVRPQVRPQR